MLGDRSDQQAGSSRTSVRRQYDELAGLLGGKCGDFPGGVADANADSNRAKLFWHPLPNGVFRMFRAGFVGDGFPNDAGLSGAQIGQNVDDVQSVHTFTDRPGDLESPS